MRLTFFLINFILLFQVFTDTGASAQSEYRSFDEIFPNLQAQVREDAFSNDGYMKSVKSSSSNLLGGLASGNLDSGIFTSVKNLNSKFYIESITVVSGNPDKYSLLKAYNVLGKVRTLKGRVYHSHSRKGEVPLFEDVTRIESSKKNTPVADPPPALRIPAQETVYLRVKDVNFGNSYYRADLFRDKQGIRYSLTNNRSITYFLIPVVKEESLIIQLYFEPIKEGILIYGLSGAAASDFVSSQADMPSAISKRLAVIVYWVRDGIQDKL